MTVILISNFNKTGTTVLDTLNGQTALIVGTAALGEGRPIDQDDVKIAFAERGVAAEVVDILAMDHDDLATRMETVDILYLAGGNTFFLLDAIRKTGLDTMIANRDTLTLVGESAGALVLGRDIGHVAPLDNPDVAPDLVSTQGLGLVDVLAVPHYKGEDWGFGEAIDAWLATDDNRDNYTLIHEEGAMVVTNGTVTWMGTQAEAEWH